MPYIKPDDKKKFERLLEMVAITRPLTPGELNYLITSIVLLSMDDVSYSDINEVVGVLECVKQEFYRRLAAPYEDKKKSLNGDVYK